MGRSGAATCGRRRVTPGKDQRRPGGGGVEAVVQRTNHRVSRQTDPNRASRVRGVVEIDLTGFDRYADTWLIRQALGTVEGCPDGVEIRLSVGAVAPVSYMLTDLGVHRFRWEIVGSPEQVRRWMGVLREVIA